jgi:hypothetical protein
MQENPRKTRIQFINIKIWYVPIRQKQKNINN